MSTRFQKKVLENGLTILGEANPASFSAAVGFFVRTGARDEQPDISGVSHFLEHMMFKGTKTRSAMDINFELGNMGAQANAFTSEENTVYYAAVLPEYLDKAIELLSDMLRPALDQTEFDVEKKVILEEIALYKDRPVHVMMEQALKAHFGSHPAGSSVLGSTESITALTSEQMRRYFETRYVASNIVFVVSGRFDWEKVTNLVEKYCGAWQKGDAKRELRRHEPQVVTKVIKRPNLMHSHVCLLVPGPSSTEHERYASSVLACILGDSSGSKAYWQLIDKGLADSCAVDVDDMDGTGVTYGYASTMPEKIDEVTEILSAIMRNANVFSDEELKRAVTKISTRLVLQGESAMRRMVSVGLGWSYRKSYTPLEEQLSIIQAITRKDIEAALQKYPLNPVTTVKLVPEKA